MATTDKIKVTKIEDLSALRAKVGEANGLSEDKIAEKVANAATEFNSVPEEGTFDHIGEKEYKLKDENGIEITRYSIGYYLGKDEKTALHVSENTIFAQTVTDEPVKVKSVKNAGKYMLKQTRISESLYSENSQDKRLFALKGKSFKTVKFPGKALKKYEADKMFAPAELTIAEAKEKLLANTEPKTYHVFTLVTPPAK